MPCAKHPARSPSHGRCLLSVPSVSVVSVKCSFSHPLLVDAHRYVEPWNLDTIPTLRGPQSCKGVNMTNVSPVFWVGGRQRREPPLVGDDGGTKAIPKEKMGYLAEAYGKNKSLAEMR